MRKYHHLGIPTFALWKIHWKTTKDLTPMKGVKE